jgi:hypothetical protein
LSVTIDGVWIGNRIYWTFKELVTTSTNNYDSLTELHTPKIIVTTVFSVFTCRCLVAALNCGRSPSSGFPNCPQPQLPELILIVIWPRHRQHKKWLVHYFVFSHCRGSTMSTELLPSNGYCAVASLHGCYLVMVLHVITLASHLGEGFQVVSFFHFVRLQCCRNLLPLYVLHVYLIKFSLYCLAKCSPYKVCTFLHLPSPFMDGDFPPNSQTLSRATQWRT